MQVSFIRPTQEVGIADLVEDGRAVVVSHLTVEGLVGPEVCGG